MNLYQWEAKAHHTDKKSSRGLAHGSVTVRFQTLHIANNMITSAPPLTVGEPREQAHGAYFPHIDGIRALAVLPVLLFHLAPKLCPGGFAGVDVFFVISGYLITGGIVRDLKNDRFSIATFYHHRVRRIIPAYLSLIAGVLLAGCIIYYATPLVLLGDSVSASTMFLANHYFNALGGDYFAPALHLQPLLHLWSLSVEEQFYLFIPLLCSMTWSFRPRLLPWLLGCLAGLSLLGTVAAVGLHKQVDAFYFLHFRAWELLAGSLCALLPSRVPATPGASGLWRPNPQTLGSLGLVLVLAPYALMSSRTPFPGLAALPSVAGAMLLIRHGNDSWIGAGLSLRPLVKVGKISYSLYLWHWPIIVFWRYLVFNQVTVSDLAGMAILSFIMGYLSWRFVEQPLRQSNYLTRRRSFVMAGVGMTLLMALGALTVIRKGWPTRMNLKSNRVAYAPEPRLPFAQAKSFEALQRIGVLAGHQFRIVQGLNRELAMEFDRFSQGGRDGDGLIGGVGQPQVFLLGDSHAGSLRPGLDQVLHNMGLSGYAVSAAGKFLCDPSEAVSRKAMRQLETLPAGTTVVLAQRWLYYMNANGGPDLLDRQLESFARRVLEMGMKLLVLADVPNREYDPWDIDARLQQFQPRSFPPEWREHRQPEWVYLAMQGLINERIRNICTRTGAEFLPIQNQFKEGPEFVAFEQRDGNRIPLYRDGHHLSRAGSLRAARAIMERIGPLVRPVLPSQPSYQASAP